MTSYLKRLLSYSLLLLVAVLAFYFAGPEAFISPGLPWIVPYLFVVSVISYLLLNRYGGKSAQAYVRAYLLSTMLKFLLCVIALLLWAFAGCGEKVPFFIAFLILFLAYLVFDVLIALGRKRSN